MDVQKRKIAVSRYLDLYEQNKACTGRQSRSGAVRETANAGRHRAQGIRLYLYSLDNQMVPGITARLQHLVAAAAEIEGEDVAECVDADVANGKAWLGCGD